MHIKILRYIKDHIFRKRTAKQVFTGGYCGLKFTTFMNNSIRIRRRSGTSEGEDVDKDGGIPRIKFGEPQDDPLRLNAQIFGSVF